MKKRIYILYHGGNCADGFSCAFIAWLKYGKGATYHPMNYGDPLPEIESGSLVYMLDWSAPLEVLNEIGARTELIVIDHHPTAKEAIQNCYAKHTLFDERRCGAILTWNFFFRENYLPNFFKYIDDRDRWKWAMSESREFSAGLRSYPFDFAVWEELTGMCYKEGQRPYSPLIDEKEIPAIKKEGAACLRQVHQQVAATLKGVRFGAFHIGPQALEPRIRIRTLGQDMFNSEEHDLIRYAPVVNCTANISEVGEALLKEYPTAQFSASYFDDSKGNRIWSFRSREDFDCSVIAKAFGGGGHKNAAGATVKIEL